MGGPQVLPEMQIPRPDPFFFFGQTLAGERTIQSSPPDDAPLPAEVDLATVELYSEDNLEVEAKRLGPVILQSLALIEPHWTRPFRPPLEGDVVGLYGQRIFNGMLRPAHPRPGIWIRPEASEEIVASNAGIVALAEDLPIRGKTVAIIHGGGITSVYSQLDRLTVDKGEKVVHGQALGIIERLNPGPNGAIRWEIYAGGIAVEPTSWLGQMLPGRNP